MPSAITSVIASADAQGRYLNSSELDSIKSIIASAEKKIDIVRLLTENREHIIIQATILLFNNQPELVTLNGNNHGDKIAATCLRDLDYYLRLVSYGLVAGSTAPIDEIGLSGIDEMYRALGIPLDTVAKGVFALEVVANSILSDEDAHQTHAYFEYIINSFDGVSHSSKQAIKEFYKQQRDHPTNLQLQRRLQGLFNNSTKATSEELDKERESWEPENYLEWLKLDKLVQQLRHQGVDNQESFNASAIAFFDSWKCMPLPLKKIVWREREIIASLYEYINDWSKIPGFSHIGVAKKPFEEHEELVGLITFNSSPADYFYDKFKIPRYIEIESLISDFANQKRVNILLESVLPTVAYSKSPASQESLSINIPTISTLTKTSLQSGDVLVGRNKNGLFNEKQAVTLSTFVIPQTSSEIVEPQVVSVRHGFKAGYTEIYTCASQPFAKIGRVFYNSLNQQEKAEKLDISLIKIEECFELNPFLKWIEATPGKPNIVFSGMLVQMYGGVSGHVTGYVNHSMVIFPGASSSVTPDFTAIIQSQYGDSGSLLVAGNSSGDPIKNAEAKGLDISQIENLRFGMVGILIEGSPSGGSYTNLTYFRPIVDICAQLGVKPYLEKHLLIKEQGKESPTPQT